MLTRRGERDRRREDTLDDGRWTDVGFTYTNRFAASSKRQAPGKGGARYYKNIGLGFKTPREAIEGTCDARSDEGRSDLSCIRA